MLGVEAQQPNEPFTAIFATVARGWAEGRVLEIIYDWGGESRTTRVRPYLLEPLATGRSIYLIGHDETAGAMRTYKVERIRQAILTQDRYEIPDAFDPAKYLAYSWGIWSSDQAPPVTVRLRFDKVVTEHGVVWLGNAPNATTTDRVTASSTPTSSPTTTTPGPPPPPGRPPAR